MAAAAANYKRILQVLEKWPIDKNKAGGRDLGEFLRSFVDKSYKENLFEHHHSYWDRQYISLSKLVNNDHKNKYSRILASSATGLTAEQCNLALSNEFLEELANEDNSYFRYFKNLISIRPSK